VFLHVFTFYPMKKLCCCLLAFSLLTSSCNTESGQKDSAFANTAKGFVKVKRVVDGDTFVAEDGTPKGLKIRLIGVDAPESHASEHKVVGYYGAEAKAFLTEYLQGKSVRLEYDVTKLDKYHRTLAYVYMPDGTFLNAELIKRGYATTLTIPPNVKFAGTFVQLQRAARNKKQGLWNIER
jgi:micrococcal nuclease